MHLPARPGYYNARRLTRREILRVGSLSLFGMTLPELLAGRAQAAPLDEASFGRAKACILLFMWGGPAH
jgi:hypothetical protein